MGPFTAPFTPPATKPPFSLYSRWATNIVHHTKRKEEEGERSMKEEEEGRTKEGDDSNMY